VAAGCVSKPERRALAEEYYNLGNAYLENGDFGRAVELFTRAAETDPELLQAHHNLSLALLRAGRGTEAIENLRRVLEEDPDNTELLSILAYGHYVLGDMAQALAGYERVLELNPGQREIRYNVAMIHWKEGRYDEASEEFLELVREDVEDEEFFDSLYNLGSLSLEKGEPELAASYLSSYLEWRPEEESTYLTLARAYEGAADYLNALNTYDSLLELSPGNAEAWFGKASILLTEVEDPVTGLESLEEALQLGFEEESELASLLQNPSLLEPQQVEAVLRKWNQYPGQ
jgi:Flp pilus assembly protein TadD